MSLKSEKKTKRLTVEDDNDEAEQQQKEEVS